MALFIGDVLSRPRTPPLIFRSGSGTPPTPLPRVLLPFPAPVSVSTAFAPSPGGALPVDLLQTTATDTPIGGVISVDTGPVVAEAVAAPSLSGRSSCFC